MEFYKMEIVVFKNNNRALKRAINPNFGDSNPEILFQGNQEEYNAGDWDTKIQESQIEASKPIATGKDFIDFVERTIRTQSKETGLTVEQRLGLLSQAENSFKRWVINEQGQEVNMWQYLEIAEDLNRTEWNEFITLLKTSKGFNGNNQSNLADQVLALAEAWEQTVKIPD